MRCSSRRVMAAAEFKRQVYEKGERDQDHRPRVHPWGQVDGLRCRSWECPASAMSLYRKGPTFFDQRGDDAAGFMIQGQDIMTSMSLMPLFGKADGFLVYIMQNNWSL